MVNCTVDSRISWGKSRDVRWLFSTRIGEIVIADVIPALASRRAAAGNRAALKRVPVK
jgi:hypothetical protein